jgi:hypothetical protein
MSHLKTWDVQPPADAVPKTHGLPSQERLPEREGVPEAALSLELITACTKLWGIYRRGEITYDELERALVQKELGYGMITQAELCDSCRVRRANVFDHGHAVCARCKNNGCRCGDCVDRGWSDYKEQS